MHACITVCECQNWTFPTTRESVCQKPSAPSQGTCTVERFIPFAGCCCWGNSLFRGRLKIDGSRLCAYFLLNTALFISPHHGKNEFSLTFNQALTPLMFQEAILKFQARPSAVLAAEEKSMEARPSDTFFTSFTGGSVLPDAAVSPPSSTSA